MKKQLLLLFITIFLSGCNRDDNKNNTLPPATQTGVGTFACYVNGKAFVDKSGGYFNCFYQLVDGEYYFSIEGISDNSLLRDISLGAYKKQIYENEIYIFLEMKEGNVSGGGGYIHLGSNYFVSFTSLEYTGELTITKLDFEKRIVSGTFWFDIPHPVTGERIEIREGRFDTLFTM